MIARCLFASVLTGLSFSPSAHASWTKQGEAVATFKATGPAGFGIVGKTSSVDITDNGTSLTITVKLMDIDTDNGLRNRHMREDLEAEKFPLISLTVPWSDLRIPAEGATVEAQGKGNFGIHGKTKDIPFSYKVHCKGGLCNVEGSAEINLKDYGINIRRYLGITVKPDISIAATFQLVR